MWRDIGDVLLVEFRIARIRSFTWSLQEKNTEIAELVGCLSTHGIQALKKDILWVVENTITVMSIIVKSERSACFPATEEVNVWTYSSGRIPTDSMRHTRNFIWEKGAFDLFSARCEAQLDSSRQAG